MNAQDKRRAGWLAQSTINAKLVAIVLVFVVMIAALTGLFTLVYTVTSGVRAYVGGEGLWSKGQKDAVYHLSRYVGSGDEADYQDYEAAIAIPLGDRRARLEMLKAEYDPAEVRAGFAAGGIPEEDVPQMILLFRHFGDVPYFKQAIEVWARAEQELMQLPPLAEALHALIAKGPLDATQQADFAARIQLINQRVTPLERRFSELIGAGAREVQSLLLILTLAITAALVAIGILFAFSISREFRMSIVALKAGVQRVTAGDLSQPIALRGRDELAGLADALNTMTAARREAESALLAAKQFQEKVMANATNAIYTMDAEGRFTTVNRRTAEITGYSERELIGQTWATMVREHELPGLHEGFAGTLRGAAPLTNREIELRRADGSWVVIVFSIAPLERDGVIFGVVGTAEDVTERKRAGAALEARTEELVRSNRELEQFAYVASHDLQEPLRTVTGFAQLLSRRYQTKLDEDGREFIAYITDGVARMKSLIEDLLAFSRVQRQHAAAAPVPLGPLLDAAKANLHAAIESAGATVSHGELPALAVDALQFTQLFQNLIGNAIKFRREAPPVVTVQALRRADDWLFTVADNGIGIEPEAAERVFQLFQRLHTRDQYEGNGIGLTLCKKIVELHGGRIWVGPRADGESGSAFQFSLPATLPA